MAVCESCTYSPKFTGWSFIFCFQYKFDEVMEGKKPLKGSEGDRVVFAAQAISKLIVLQYLVKRAQMYASLIHQLALML